MAQASRDENFVPTLLAVSSVDGVTPVVLYADPVTHRLLVDLAGGSGTVTSVSVVSANGFAGTVANASTTPAITLSTTITGILQGNGTAISAITIGSGLSFVGGTLSATGGGITIGTTTITSGTNTRILYNNAGVVGEYLVSGSGTTVALTTGPTISGAILTGTVTIDTLQASGSAGVIIKNSGGTTVLDIGPANTTNSSFAGAVNFGGAASPSSNDGAALGASGQAWSDLFLASGAVINFAASNVVLTHSSGILEVTTGDLRVTTAGTNSASVVTVGGTQTLTNKTFTAPRFADLGFIADANGNEILIFDTVTSAVNEITLANAATGNNPNISATGGDTNIGITLTPKGSGKIVHAGQTNFGAFTAYFTETDNGNSGTSDTIDWGVSNKQKSTLTGNCTFTFTAPPGPCTLTLKLVQDATGSRTVTWPSSVKWSGGTAPTLTTTASRADIISFYYDGTVYYGTAILNFVTS